MRGTPLDACVPVCVLPRHVLHTQELQLENAGLKAQLVQKTVELNNTLAEVLQLLDRGACLALEGARVCPVAAVSASM